MAGKNKRAKKIRKSFEFELERIRQAISTPRASTSAYAWSIEDIRSARTDQMLGKFKQPARLAESMRTDSAIYVAWLNRLAPQRGLPVELKAAGNSVRAMRIRDEADALFGKNGVGLSKETCTSVDSDLTNHGNAFACNVATPRDDGSRVDFTVKHWPIEFVRWDAARRSYMARIDGEGFEVPIVHGDGRWIVFEQLETEPWKSGAVLPGGLLWASRAFTVRDRNKANTAHGNAKVVGTMPEGIPLQDKDGNPTPEAAEFLALLQDVANVDTPVGIKPAGALLDYITNNSQAWQIFKESILSDNSDAAKIYLGQDGTTNNAGGNYIKSEVLFGVRNDLVEGNLEAIERGILTGAIEPWTAVNFGDSTLAPRRVYLMPDADEDARREQLAIRHANFVKSVKEYRDAGFDITPEWLAAHAKEYGVEPPPLKDANPNPSAAAPPVGLPSAAPPAAVAA